MAVRLPLFFGIFVKFVYFSHYCRFFFYSHFFLKILTQNLSVIFLLHTEEAQRGKRLISHQKMDNALRIVIIFSVNYKVQ